MEKQAADPRQDLPLMHGPSGVLATAGLLVGAAGMLLAFFTLGGARRMIGSGVPPSLLAVNLAFCAILMGVWTLYRIRGMTGQQWARVGGGVALGLGLAGPLIFSAQSAQWRRAIQDAELGNVRAIVAACRAWAQDHDGRFPDHLGTLALTGSLPYGALESPYVPRREPTRWPVAGSLPAEEMARAAASVDGQSGYIYVGHDLTAGQAGTPQGKSLVVVFGREPHMGRLAIGWADGRAALLLPQDVAEARRASDAARKELGLPALLDPS